jgi:hypothetical protein
MAKRLSIVRRPLEYVAFWQFLTFALLLVLVWLDEVMDFPSLYYGEPPSDIDWIRASVLSAGVIIVGFVTIAHTYVQQGRMMKGIITVCSYCHNVHIHEKVWSQMEEFVSEHTQAEFSHGICPACYAKLLKDNKLAGDTTMSALKKTGGA